jgi:rubredoxin
MSKHACEGCGHTFDERNLFQMVTGWKRRGSQALKAPRFEQRFACQPCVDAMAKSGQRWIQEELPL